MSYIAALPKELRNLLDHYVNYTYWKIVSDVYEFCFAMTDEQTDLDWFYDAELKPFGFSYKYVADDVLKGKIAKLNPDELITYDNLSRFLIKYCKSVRRHYKIVNNILWDYQCDLRIAHIGYTIHLDKYIVIRAAKEVVSE